MRRWLSLALVGLVVVGAVGLRAQETPRFRARISTLTVTTPPADPSVITELLAEGSTANVSTYTSSGTLSCALNALCLCAIAYNDAAGPETPTLTGGGQTTWTQVDSVAYHSNQYGIHVFRSLGEAGTAAAMVADFGGDAQTGNIFHCWQITGVNTSGTNGSGAVVQADDFAGAGVNSVAPDGLAALGSPNLLWQIAANVSGGRVWTRDTGFLSGTDIDIATPAVQARVQYLANGTDTTPTLTMDGAANAMATIAVEIAITGAGAGGGAVPLVAVESPTANPSLTVTTPAQTITGTASDDGSYTLAWTCPQCGVTSGTPTGTDAWSFNVTLACATNPGTSNVITVTATDTAGQARSDVLTLLCLTPDASAPEVTITSPTNATTYATSTQALTLSGTATDAEGVSSCSISCATCTPTTRTTTVTGTTSATWAATSSINLASGANTVQVSCQDAATNAGTDTLTVTYTASDVTTPVVAITTNSGNNFTAATLPQTIAGSCSDAVGCVTLTASCTNTSPSAPVVAGTTAWSFSLAGITSGNAAVCTVTGTDQAGNMGTDSITVTYIADLQIQTITLASLIEDQAGQSRCVTAAGGVPPYTWSVSAGALPTGMSLSGSTTATECFTGTPTTAQTVTPTFQVVDSQGSPDSDTQQISVTVSAPGADGPHTYFDTLKALPEVQNIADCSVPVPGDNGACSLRNQAQILRLSNGNASTGDTANGHIAAGTDYATITVGQDETMVPNGDMLNAIHGAITTGDILYVWDTRFTPSFLRTTCGGFQTISTYKMWNFRFNVDGIYNETRAHWQPSSNFPFADCSEIFAISTRVYAGGASTGGCLTVSCFPAGIAITGDESYTPTGQGALAKYGYKVKVNKWTRYIGMIKAHVPASSPVFDAWEAATGVTLAPSGDSEGDGTWSAFYLWVCDEDRACQRLLFGVPWVNESNNSTSSRDVDTWNLEWNTSTETRPGAPMTAHVRNLVILRNYPLDLSGVNATQDIANNPTIFVKPISE